MNKTINKALSYCVEVLITPNWNQIIKRYFPELKTDEDVKEFITKLTKKFKMDEDESLYNKRFIFMEFYDGISGLNLIWSRNYQQFFDNLEVQGNLLADKEGKIDEQLEEMMNVKNKNESYRYNSLTVSPNGIYIFGGGTISRIPYFDIINFFVRLQQETRCGRYQIKKFPRTLQDIFDRDKIGYAPSIDVHSNFQRQLYPEEELPESEWLEKAGVELYKQKVIQHIFETQYYSIAFGIKFFNPNAHFINKQ